MKKPDPLTYLEDICTELDKKWPANRTVNIVCHGHSVPSGYFATPFVDTFNAYPHLLHKIIKERFPYGVVNVIVTAIGGENSQEGSQRFEEDVLCHKPDVLTLDYSLNDRAIGLVQAKTNWSQMIERALEKEIKIILMTPSWEKSYFARNSDQKASWKDLEKQTKQVRNLAEKYGVGLCDTFEVFSKYCEQKESLVDLLSHGNHPNRKGHELIANELGRWFLAR